MNQLQQEIKNISIDVLSKKEKEKVQECFYAYDKNGSKTLNKNELKYVLQELQINPTEEDLSKMINAVDSTGKQQICLEDFQKVIAFYKKQNQDNEEEDIILAFVALGGSIDKQGSVDKTMLKHLVQSDFQLSIDMSKFIKEMTTNQGNTSEIKFEDFKNLLSN